MKTWQLSAGGGAPYRARPHRAQLPGRGIWCPRAAGASNLEALVGYVPLEIRGTERVESLAIEAREDHAGQELAVTGVFVEIGAVPDSTLVEGLTALNAAGEILVDRLGRTRIPGLFAAGDVTDAPYKQAIMAAGDGAKAAMAAWE